MIPENTKPTNFFKFEGLRIYHKSVDFINAILSLSNTVQTNAQKIIVDQFLNEAGHISANIIEGAGRSKTEFIEYLQKAKSNIGKCVMLCALASKQSLIPRWLARLSSLFRNMNQSITQKSDCQKTNKEQQLKL